MYTRDTVFGDQEFKPPSEVTRKSVKSMTNNALIGVAGNSKSNNLQKLLFKKLKYLEKQINLLYHISTIFI